MASPANAGPTPKPPSLKLLGGRSPGRDSGGRKVDPPPAFVRLPPEAPDLLGEHARAEWDRVVPELQRLGLIKSIDRAALASYCEMWDLFVRATEDVHESGLTVENHSVRKDGSESVWFTKNPSIAVQRDAQAALRAWCAEFGLTPAAEGRLSVGGAPDGDDRNPFGG